MRRLSSSRRSSARSAPREHGTYMSIRAGAKRSAPICRRPSNTTTSVSRSSARRRLRDQIRFGQLALLGGIVIFLASMTARTILASALPAGAPRMLDEGLIVLAWLALWRPAESLVYGWVPLYRERRLYERLAAIRVSVRVEVNHAQGSRPAMAHPEGRAGLASPSPNVAATSPRAAASEEGVHLRPEGSAVVLSSRP